MDLRFIIKPFYEDFEMLFVQSFSQKQNAKFQGHLQVSAHNVVFLQNFNHFHTRVQYIIPSV